MHKIHHLHTSSEVGILKKVGPKVQLPKGPNKIVLAQKWGGGELRSSRSTAVPQPSPLPTTNCLGAILSTLSPEWGIRKNPAVP